MKIAYLCQYYIPEPSAPSARISEFSKQWVLDGHQVTVITGMPNHPNGSILKQYKGKLTADENIDGVRVLRNWLYATPNRGVIKKTISHLSFMVSTVLLSLHRLNKIDILIASSPTFFSAFAGLFISRIRKVPFVFEVRDLWPAIFVELGILQHPFLIKILELLEMFLYSNADLIVTVTNSFRDRLIERGIESGKIIVIFNGAMVSIYRPGSKDRALVEELSLEDKFVVSYIGSHGISQGVNTIVNAAEILRLRSNIDFLLVGDGAMKKSIGQTIIDKKLSNVKMLPPQSKDLIPDFYRISDVCIVPLKNISLFDSFVPSKIFEIMACGIPIIASVVGEAKEILQRSQSAKIISPESAVELVTAIEWMFDNHQERSKMAESGRMFVCDHYDRSILAKNYISHLRSIVL